MKKLLPVCFGEFLGTFILVFFGIGTVGAAVLFNAFSGLMQVALIWGLGVTLAIYATRHLSCAHLNPAVTLGMTVAGRMDPKLLPWYILSQLAGGIAAGLLLFGFLGSSISQFEAANGIIRGAPESVRTAMMFGEYFPNPGLAQPWLTVGMGTAAGGEFMGTFLLVTMIFLLTEGCNVGRPAEGVSPLFIGATVTAIICVSAPITQAGLNPARDFGPRLVAYFAGWGAVAIPGPQGGFFIVYILSPLLAGVAAAIFFKLVAAPLMEKRLAQQQCSCNIASRDEISDLYESPLK